MTTKKRIFTLLIPDKFSLIFLSNIFNSLQYKFSVSNFIDKISNKCHSRWKTKLCFLKNYFVTQLNSIDTLNSCIHGLQHLMYNYNEFYTLFFIFFESLFVFKDFSNPQFNCKLLTNVWKLLTKYHLQQNYCHFTAVHGALMRQHFIQKHVETHLNGSNKYVNTIILQ